MNTIQENSSYENNEQSSYELSEEEKEKIRDIIRKGIHRSPLFRHRLLYKFIEERSERFEKIGYEDGKEEERLEIIRTLNSKETLDYIIHGDKTARKFYLAKLINSFNP